MYELENTSSLNKTINKTPDITGIFQFPKFYGNSWLKRSTIHQNLKKPFWTLLWHISRYAKINVSQVHFPSGRGLNFDIKFFIVIWNVKQICIQSFSVSFQFLRNEFYTRNSSENDDSIFKRVIYK